VLLSLINESRIAEEPSFSNESLESLSEWETPKRE